MVDSAGDYIEDEQDSSTITCKLSLLDLKIKNLARMYLKLIF